MTIKYGKGQVSTDYKGLVNLIIKFDGNILIPKINKDIKLRLSNNLIHINGDLSKGEDNVLFEYFGQFEPKSSKDINTSKNLNLVASGLGFWNKGSDNVLWENDTSAWGEKEHTYIHGRKLKRKLK